MTHPAAPMSELRTAQSMPDLLTIDELAIYFQVSKATIYGWRKEGGGPTAVKLGKHLRFPKSSVLEWAHSRGA